jgi:hypothetical protein
LGRGKQRSEGLTPSHLRGARRDCSQAINDSWRDSPSEETQTFQSPQPLLPDFQGAKVSIQHNRTRTANALKLTVRQVRGARLPSGAALELYVLSFFCKLQGNQGRACNGKKRCYENLRYRSRSSTDNLVVT